MRLPPTLSARASQTPSQAGSSVQKLDCPLSEAQERQALSIITETLGLGEAASLMEVEPGQPLRLNLLQATATGDKDTALIPMLKAGVTAGVHDPIPSSLQWPKKSQPYQDFMPLKMCEGNWSAAEAKPSIVQSLIDKEVASVGCSTSLEAERQPNPAALSHSSRQAQPRGGTWQRPPPGPRQYGLPGQPLPVAAPGSAHCASSPCATAPQSLAVRRWPAGSPPPEQRRPAAGPASRSSRLS